MISNLENKSIQENFIGVIISDAEIYFQFEKRIISKRFLEPYQKLIDLIKEEYSKSDSIDIANLAVKAEAHINMEHLIEWMGKGHPNKAEEYLFQIGENHKNTILTEMSYEIQQNMTEKRPSEFTRASVDAYLEQMDLDISNEPKHSSELTKGVIDNIQKAMETEELTGVETGFPTLNGITGGWQGTDLVIIAARPGMGKTTFTMQTAKYAAEAGEPIGIFSLEMEDAQILRLLIGSEAKVPVEYMRTGNLNDKEFQRIQVAAQKVGKLPVYISDDAFTLQDICNHSRFLVRKKGVKAIIIDYLQLIEVLGLKNSYERVSKVSRQLKRLAKELKVPVIALSQLSRSVETRGGDKRPMLSDLRESGTIEQDADMVNFLYRPSYYGLEDLSSGDDVTEFIIAKYRHGRTGVIDLSFDKGQMIEKEAGFLGGIDPKIDPFSLNDSDIPMDDSIPSDSRPDFTDQEDIPF